MFYKYDAELFYQMRGNGKRFLLSNMRACQITYQQTKCKTGAWDDDVPKTERNPVLGVTKLVTKITKTLKTVSDRFSFFPK